MFLMSEGTLKANANCSWSVETDNGSGLKRWGRWVVVDLISFYSLVGRSHLLDTHKATKSWLLDGYLAHQKHPPPQDPHRSLGIVLLQGPTGVVFLMIEVPLYRAASRRARAHIAGEPRS